MPPEKTLQTSCANATPSPTGAPPFGSLLFERDEFTNSPTVFTWRVQPVRVSQAIRSSYLFLDFPVLTDCLCIFGALVGGHCGIPRATILPWHSESHISTSAVFCFKIHRIGLKVSPRHSEWDCDPTMGIRKCHGASHIPLQLRAARPQ